MTSTITKSSSSPIIPRPARECRSGALAPRGNSAARVALLPSEGMPSQRERPRLSVIVPVRNGLQYLPQSLTALRGSDLPASRWELIVVDDSSHDGSGDLAGHYADRVIRLLDGPWGPAVARNHGVAVARGELLA